MVDDQTPAIPPASGVSAGGALFHYRGSLYFTPKLLSALILSIGVEL